MANSTSRKRLTIYIGRFQPFHNGHVNILEQAIESSDLVLVLVGSSFQARTIKNPFSFHERFDMISNWAMSKYNWVRKWPEVKPLRDQPYNDAKWMQSVQELVNETIIDEGWNLDEVDVAITGSDRDDSTWYLKSFPQYISDLKPAVPPGEDLSATNLRDKLFAAIPEVMEWDNVPSTTKKFLKQFIDDPYYKQLQEEYNFNKKYKEQFSSLKYPPTFVTADSVIIQSGHVLVVERGALPGKGLWALPGGFVKSNQTLLDAAVTEVVEETGLKLAEGKKSVDITKQILKGSLKAVQNFDAPNRSLRGRTFTTAHLFRLDDSKPLPSVKGQFAPLEDTGGIEGVVETKDAFWLPLSTARAKSENWFEDHHGILDWAIGVLKD